MNTRRCVCPPTSPATITPLHISTIPVTDGNRAQLGMSTRLLEDVDYDRLVMSLQSPLPNDQDMAISVCTLLSNETKHVLKFPKAPRILELLLAHAGIYNHCKLRELMETSYWESRQLSHNNFWMETVPEGHTRDVLCECFVQKVNHSLGVELEYCDFLDSDVIYEPELTEEEKWILVNRKRISEVDSPEFSLSDCCKKCPCKGVKSKDPLDPFPALDQKPQPVYLIRKSVYSDDRIGQRIAQIANILRNLSFEEDNALLMANNQTLLRFILLSSECCWGTIPQLALDLLGNISQHFQLREPSIDPLSCRIMGLIVDGLFSSDRFRILRSLECLRELCKKEGNDYVLNLYVRLNVYKRISELLTISDIMLLIYTLECLLSMTGLGEAVCNELARVQGSVATLVSLVTVEAQSYGPKGCILMRVVETVTGNVQPQQAGAVGTQQQPALAQSPALSNHVAAANNVVSTAGPLNTVVVPVVNTPRPSHSPIPFSSSSAIPFAGIASKTGVLTSSLVQNLVHTSSLTPNPSALQVQLQQAPGVIPSQSVSNHMHQVKVPSPALSPSLSLSPAPSPGPPVGHLTHMVQSTNTQLHQRQSTMSQKPNNANSTNDTSTSSVCLSSPKLSITQGANTAAYTSFSGSPRHFVSLGSASPTAGIAFSNVSTSSLPVTTQTAVFSSSGLSSTANVIMSNATSSGSNTIPNSCTTSESAVSQFANQSLNQQLIIPSISLPLVTPKGTLSEEGWALAWLKGAFDVVAGSSIEQGESYRMYCSARKNPQKVLTIDQFVQCVKCAYGAPVGPVIKQFGSSLSFFEGIRPKIIAKPAVMVSTLGVSSNATSVVTTQPPPVCFPSVKTVSVPTVPVATTAASALSPGMVINARQICSAAADTEPPSQANKPMSAHIPSVESKTLSPILKATLSRPPKPKNQSSVTQRQQKKLEQESLPKKMKTLKNSKSDGKVNGVDGKVGTEDSSASSSVNSNEDSEGTRVANTNPPFTSFQGILRNGLNPEECSKEDTNVDDLTEGKNRLKGMLIDLLERKVNPMENPNGLGNREIRISDRGLELVDKLDENVSNSSAGSGGPVVVSVRSGSLSNPLLDGGESSQQSQMTFYSASEPQVTLFSQVVTLTNTKFQNIGSYAKSMAGGTSGVVLSSSGPTPKVSETILMSGGGGGGGGVIGDGSVIIGHNGLRGNGNASDNSSSAGSVGIVPTSSGLSTLTCNVAASSTSPFSTTSSATVCSVSAPACKQLDVGGDLLEKFNQISDLIVVSPEQLGLKRTHSEDSTSNMSVLEPPTKKANIVVNGNGCLPGILNEGRSSAVPMSAVPTAASVSDLTLPDVTTTQSSVLQTSLNSTLPSNTPLTNSTPTTSAVSPHIVFSASSNSSVVSNSAGKPLTCGSPLLSATVSSTNMLNTSISSSTSANNQMMQLRLSVNPQNQLTFSRQLVLPSGQQLILSTKSQSQIQGQVIISKPHVSSNDQMAKAIIILQPSQQQQQTTQIQQPQQIQLQQQSHIQQQLQQQPQTAQNQQQATQLQSTTMIQQLQPQSQIQTQLHQPPLQQVQQPIVQTSTNPATHSQVHRSQLQQQLQIHPHQHLSLQGTHGTTSPLIQSALQQQVQVTTVGSNITVRQPCRNSESVLSSVLADSSTYEAPYLCEWSGCGQRFNKPGKVFLHVSKVHTPETLTEAVRCEWGPSGCDPLLRKRLSLMTHIQDRHCTKHALDMSLYRRRNKIEAPPPPQNPTHHHLGYAPNAAFHAIKRHAMQFMNPKELLDDNEGPVTKSIRLTSALILKNLVNYSSSGRKILRGYESQLATIAMSNVESSRTIAQLLYDMEEINS